MGVHVSTIVFQTINFLVLVWILQRVLYRPVQRVIARRREEIAAGMAAVTTQRAAADSLRAEAESQHAEAAAQRDGLLAEAQTQAEANRDALLAVARQQAELERSAQRSQLEQEGAAAEVDLRGRMADLAVTIARHLLADVGREAATEQMLARTMSSLRALDAREREAVATELGNDRPVRVVTATPLAPDRRAACVAELGDMLTGKPVVEFVDDPDLLAGVEVHLPHLVVRHSWRDQLGQVRRSLVADGTAARQP